MKLSRAIFKTFFLSLAIIANVHFAWAQQSIVPNGYQTYLDQNGKPLSSGKVFYYTGATGSTVPKTTYQDIGGTTPNTNPIILNAAGRALVWGTGNYRQIVQDKNNNIIWDTITSAAGSGSGGGTIATGDGDLVGTIKPWAGMTAPNQYMFTYGQEVSRTTYSALFTAIASTQAIFCNSGSPILTGLGDTTNFWIGMSVEIGCVSGGVSTIISKTSSSVTLAANANLTENVNAVFFPWGRGNGTTTFNLPDFRGLIPMGNNIMGGVASSNVSDTNFGTQGASSSGALGGASSSTLILSNIPGHNHPITDPGHVHTQQISPAGGSPGGFLQANVSGVYASSGINTQSNTTGITVNYSGGGIGVSATVAAGGSGYTNGSQTITVSGGTCSVQPQFIVTVSGNAFSGTPSLLTAGSCTIAPANPASTTGGGGTGGTLNIIYSAQPISLIQPSKTVNYIIKVTPDANSATASGVTSLGGMTGDIACGSNLICTGNIISSTASSVSTGFTITPTINTTNQALVINQTIGPPGSQSSGPYSGSLSTIFNNNYTSTASGFSTVTGLLNGQVSGQRIDYTSAGNGAGTGPIHTGLTVTAAETSQGQQLIGLHASAATNIASAGNDDIWGFTGYSYVGPSANLNQAHTIDAQSGIRSGAVVATRDGVSIVSIGDGSATTIDSAITISSQPSPYAASPTPFTNGITLWTPGATQPIATTGSVITANSAFTAANFANLPTATFSSNIFNFSNFKASGTGGVIFGAGTNAAPTNGIRISSTNAGALLITPNADGSTSPIFEVDASTSSAVNGIGIVGTATANPSQINAIGPSSNIGTLLQTKGTGQITLSNYTAASVIVNVGNPGSVTGTLLTVPTVVNSLPSCTTGLDGARAFVTNNNTAISFGGAVTTGGTTHSPVYCDGSSTSWKQG